MKRNKQRVLKPSDYEGQKAAVDARVEKESAEYGPQVTNVLKHLTDIEVGVTIRSTFNVVNAGFMLGAIEIIQRTIENERWVLESDAEEGGFKNFVTLKAALDYLVEKYSIPADVVNAVPVDPEEEGFTLTDDHHALGGLIGDISEGMLDCSYNDHEVMQLWLSKELNNTFKDLDPWQLSKFQGLYSSLDCERVNPEDPYDFEKILWTLYESCGGWPVDWLSNYTKLEDLDKEGIYSDALKHLPA